MTTTAPIAIELEQASLVVPAYEQADRSARSLTTGLLTAAFDPPQRTHRVLLDAIDLSVRDGERVAVLGGNGAGKSTLLRMVAGAYTPSSGTVRIQGRMQALLNVSLGFNVDATVRENIYLRGAAMGLSLREIHSLAPSVLEFAGLAGRAGDRLRVLSAGQRMRLSFAVTTVQQTDIMVMDEWIGTGDAEFFDKARERLKGRVDSARIVLLASHSVPLLMQVCERAIYLREGRLIASGDLLDVVEEFIPQALPPKRPKPVELDPEVEARRIAELEAQRDAQRSATLAAMRRRARSDVEKESRAARAEFARAQKAHARKEEVQAKRETHLRIRELQLKEQGDMIRAAREALERAREQQTRAREAHAQALEVRLRAAREFQAPAVEPPGAPLVQEPARESPEPAQEPPPSPSSRDALEQQRLAQLQTLRDAAHAERKREVRAEMERTARAEIVQAARMAQAMAGGEAAFAERKREVRAEMERAAREAQAHAGHDGPALAVREVVRGATVAIAGPAEQVAPKPNAVPATAANDAFHSHESDNANVNTMNHTNNEAGDNTAADVAPVATTPQAGIEAGEADTPVAPSAEDAPAGDVAVAAPPPVVEVKSSCDPSGTLLSTPVFRQGVQPIFIIGAPRSATSMLTWAIGQHPNIQPMPETAWIASLAVGAANSHALGASRGRFSHLSNVGYPLEPFLRRLGESVHDIVHDCFEERCHLCYGDFRKSGKLQMAPDSPNPGMHLRQSLNEPKRRWIDGTPLNSHYSWALAEMFPEARFIHSLRRPDEVATSLEGFANVGADPQELSEGLRTWCQHTEAAWLAERAFGAERVFRLHFTRISSEPETMIRDLTAFLGEEFAPASMRPLSRRLNSSKVDDKRAANLERLQELPAFIAAQELYAAVLDTPPAEPDAVALAALRARFLSLCEGRTLV